jgi:hypothetical protein
VTDPVLLTAAEMQSLVDGQPSRPELAPVAGLIATALVHLDVEVVTAVGSATILGWLGNDEGVLVVPELGPEGGAVSADTPRRLVGVHPTHVVAALCRLLEVGPRPRPTAAVTHTGAGTAEELLAEGVPGGEVRQVWSVRTSWRTTSGQEGTAGCRVLDTSAGYFTVEPRDGETALQPTDPTAVFVALREVLPRDADLEG